MGKAPSGILKVFLVLPEGEENFIRSPVGDLKSFIGRVCGRTELDIQEGLRKKNLNCFFVASKIPQLAALGPAGC